MAAQGSEKFAWKLFPGSEKRCWQCKREGLKVAEVGELRTLYPGRKTQFLCTTCQQENLARAMEEYRAGLQARKENLRSRGAEALPPKPRQ